MVTKLGLLRTTSRGAPIADCLRRDTPRWLGALHAIRGGADEPTLEDLIADPVAEAVMQADGVHPGQVIALFERLRRRREG